MASLSRFVRITFFTVLVAEETPEPLFQYTGLHVNCRQIVSAGQHSTEEWQRTRTDFQKVKFGSPNGPKGPFPSPKGCFLFW